MEREKVSTEKPLIIRMKELLGTSVTNREGDNLGEIADVAVDFQTKCIAYTVLGFSGFLGTGRKLFAIPFDALSIGDQESFVKGRERKLILNIPKEALKDAEGFDETNWPREPDRNWLRQVYTRYGFKPYWEK